MAGKKKRKKTSPVTYLFLLIGFLFGAAILFYPTFSEIWNNYRDSKLLSDYTDAVEELEPEDYSQIWADARAYNEQHTVNTIVDAFDEDAGEYVLGHPYDTLLNPLGNEIMGYVEIPKIDVKLAIYHGTGTEALENGCGHIEGTSLPIGGESTHAVLSAHRGLPNAKLFSDLDQLEEGDIFLLRILDETLAYEVDQILTVEPTETDALQIEEGKDLVTLVTCTPYGVNSHRLLVRGHRTEYVEETEEQQENTGIVIRNPFEGTDNRQKILVIAVIGFMLFLLILEIIFSAKERKRKKQKAQAEKEAVDKEIPKW